MRKSCLAQVCGLVLLLCAATCVSAQGGQSRYVTLVCNDANVLQEFNGNLELNQKLEEAVRQKNVITVADEVLAKVDVIVEKVQVVLDMFPNNYHVNLVLLPDAGDVASVYRQKYGKNVSHIAYYSLSEKTIYISAEDTKLRVLAHELGHSVVDYYFQPVRPPYNIHELMAQFAEQHVTD